MKNTRIIPMRRLPGPASRPLGEGVKTPEAPVGLFRGWQRTQTQSSVRTLRSLRQQMDVWFCLMQESSAERHCCVTADPDQIKCAPSGARPGILCFSLDFDLHRCGPTGHNQKWCNLSSGDSDRVVTKRPRKRPVLPFRHKIKKKTADYRRLRFSSRLICDSPE